MRNSAVARRGARRGDQPSAAPAEDQGIGEIRVVDRDLGSLSDPETDARASANHQS